MKPQFNFNDGGRAAAGYKGQTGDCVTRAIAIATGLPYGEVYAELHLRTIHYGKTKRDMVAKKIQQKGSNNSPRNGVFRDIYHAFLLQNGWAWQPTMEIGGGCKVHLRADELPNGRIIVRLSKHICAVIDGIINDTYDCSREGSRCVYGYYYKQTNKNETQKENSSRSITTNPQR